MLKRSKGDWAVERTGPFVRIVAGSKKKIIARVASSDSAEETSANAVLMARAPELLEVLKHHCQELRARGLVPLAGMKLIESITGDPLFPELGSVFS